MMCCTFQSKATGICMYWMIPKLNRKIENAEYRTAVPTSSMSHQLYTRFLRFVYDSLSIYWWYHNSNHDRGYCNAAIVAHRFFVPLSLVHLPVWAISVSHPYFEIVIVILSSTCSTHWDTPVASESPPSLVLSIDQKHIDFVTHEGNLRIHSSTLRPFLVHKNPLYHRRCSIERFIKPCSWT